MLGSVFLQLNTETQQPISKGSGNLRSTGGGEKDLLVSLQTSALALVLCSQGGCKFGGQ